MRFWAGLAAGILLTATGAQAQAAGDYKSSLDGLRAKTKGVQTLVELALPSGGERAKRARVVAQRRRGGLVLRWMERKPDCDLSEDTGCFSVRAERALPGTKLKRLEWLPYGPGGRQLLAVTEEFTPDDRTQHITALRLVDAHFQPSLERSFVLGPDATAHGADQAQPGLSVQQEGEGPVLVWVEGPSVLTVPGRQAPQRFAVGRKERVFRYHPEKRAFLPAEQRIIDLYPWLPIERARVSGQSLQPDDNLGRPEWGADHDLATSWRLPRVAERPSIAVKLLAHSPVRMVRIIPGCLGAWDRYDRPRKVRLTLGNGRELVLDLAKLQPLPEGVRALGRFPQKDGAEVLLFFDEPQQTDRAKLEVLETTRTRRPFKRRSPELCLTEIGFY